MIGPLPEVPAGYQLTPLPGPGRWVELAHDQCGGVVVFVNPETHRLAWYVGSHRCGPLGSGWQEGAPEAPASPVEHLAGDLGHLGRALDRLRRTVGAVVEPEHPDLAAVVTARLTDAGAHLAAAVDHLTTEGSDQ